MEIKNTLTVTRREGEGNIRGNKGKRQAKNMNRRLMGMDNGVGIHCGSRERGWGKGEQ